MNRLASLLLLALAVPMAARAAAPPARATRPFDADWRFLKSDARGAEQPSFDDAGWRKLSLPHDWSIEGPILEANPSGQGGAFLPAGVGWYRKHFALPRTDAGKRVFVEFDGIMANSDVWINGALLGHRPYGYSSLRYELTGHLRLGGADNVVAVRADNSQQPASRWAPGAGIDRNVRLLIVGDAHVDTDGTFVTATGVGAKQAAVHVQSTVVNQSDKAQAVSLRIALIAPDGKAGKTFVTAAQTIAPNQTAEFAQEIAVASPDRWDIDHPALYRARVEVLAGNAVDDVDTVAFGIREFHFDAATGFWLNGRNFKILGAAIHADAGALGNAVPAAAWERRLAALRKVGVNAIRTAHNPPDPTFLAVADRMGFLVMDELFDCWTVGKNPYDYHLYFREWYKTDARDAIRRDRNHPSIILWSAGNEIHDTPNAALAHEILSSLVDIIHENDPSRPATQALFRPNASHDYDNGLADLLDVVGQNYREPEILAAHAQKPTRKIIGTENGQDRKAWLALRDNAPYSGQFLWSGVDYLGEAHQWPYIGHDSGLLDRTDYPHVRGMERQSWWSATPMVKVVRRLAPTAAGPADPGEGTDPKAPRETLFNDWTPGNAAPHEENVEVYSNAETVELSLNGKSLGAQQLHADASPRIWKVDYAPGTLKAVATNHGKMVASEELRTAGAPARIVLSTGHAKVSSDFDDVSYIEASVVDANGILVPAATNEIAFALKGPGTIVGVDNADNTSHEPFQAAADGSAQRAACRGRAVAIIRANAAAGRITVAASSPGLSQGSIVLEAVPEAPTR